MGPNLEPQPRRPTHLVEHAEMCLCALSAEGLGDRISLGGALALLHYLDYRPTHDVDAWWVSPVTTEEQDRVLQVLEAALRPLGEVRKRSWGDVVSVELLVDQRAVFSFQVARRDAQLQPSVPAVWVAVLLDSFPDVVASKMVALVALVERGAPRDLRDIHAVCQAGLTTPMQCWTWWRERQQLADSDTDTNRARLAVETHLSRIASHRPLGGIDDLDEKATAAAVRGGLGRSFSVRFRTDGTLYPDVETPSELVSLAAQVDFVARLCAAWDFGVLPDAETIEEIRRPEWREAVDVCRLLTSPAYHLVRSWHQLAELPYLGQEMAYIRDDPSLAYV